ncbi:MAG TPA: alkaline phosphatase family protein [Ktedonobacteraceae bacterium]
MPNNRRLVLRFLIAGAVLLLLLLLVIPRLLSLHPSGISVTGSMSVATIASTGATGTPASTVINNSALPDFQHIFLIVMENNSYSNLIGNADAPWINSAAHNYIVATNYYGVGHPSEPDYIALTSGSVQGVTSDADVTLNAPNIVDQLEKHGRSWTAYMQGLFSAGNTNKLASTAGDYARKHNPFVSYADIQQNPARLARIVDFSQFASNLAGNAMPAFVWITPDLCHDMHGAGACSDTRGLIQVGDAFLRATVNQIMHSSAWTGHSAIFITWDESEADDNSGCCGANPGGGHILTLIIPYATSPPQTLTRPYNHYSLLATIEDAWSLGCLATTCDVGSVRPMAGVF